MTENFRSAQNIMDVSFFVVKDLGIYIQLDMSDYELLLLTLPLR